MSHIVGTVQIPPGGPQTIGPGTTNFNPPAAPGGTKFLILHFTNLNFSKPKASDFGIVLAGNNLTLKNSTIAYSSGNGVQIVGTGSAWSTT